MRLIIASFLFTFLNFNLFSQCDHPDYEGLMEIYHGNNGENWKLNTGWKEGAEGESCNPCDFNGMTWQYVTCTNDRVTGLEIGFENMTGSLPDLKLSELEVIQMQANDLTGPIPNFSHSPNLKHIELDLNELTGEIPAFDYCEKLEFLELDRNCLTGQLPIFKSKKLQKIHIDENELTGPVPNYNLPDLTRLLMSDNNFTGRVPACDSMPKLRAIGLGNNNLVGENPDFPFCPEMVIVSLHDNNLEGFLHEYEHTNILAAVNLSNNNLRGCIPMRYCGLQTGNVMGNPQLQNGGDITNLCNGAPSLKLPCMINGQSGEINDECECVPLDCEFYEDDFDALMLLYASTNGDAWINNQGWEAGKFGLSCSPCSYLQNPWYGVKCNYGRVTDVDLDGLVDFNVSSFTGNNLKGDLPNLQMDLLNSLNLVGNAMEGRIELTGLPNLTQLMLTQNNFTGPLPNINSLPNLREFRASFNQLTGEISDELLDQLNTFSCSHNLLEGCIPDGACDVELIDLQENSLLPWEGDLTEFCMGADQIGAPCNLAEEGYFIDENCECTNMLSSVSTEINSIEVFPNPVKATLNISNIQEDILGVVHSLAGHKVHEFTSNQTDLSHLPSGVYILSMEMNKLRLTRRIVKL